MKTTSLFPAILLAVVVSGTVALAQENTSAPAPAAAPASPTVVNGLVYVDKLPTPTALLKDAESEGLTIARMEQSPDRMVVVYQYPNGSTRAFAYTTTVNGSPAPVATATVPVSTATYRVISEPAPTTTVVYAQPQTVYYEPRYVRYYDPVWDGWAPLALGLGIGLSWNNGYHGGYHGGHGGWHH
jgi:hypothetical protein